MADSTKDKGKKTPTPRRELTGEDESLTSGKPLTLAERAAAAANGAYDKDMSNTQESLFENGVLDGDPALTPNTLISPGTKVSTRVKMNGAQVPLRGGLIDPTKEVRVAAVCHASTYHQTPIGEWRDDGTRNIEEWKINAVLTPTYVEYLGTGEESVEREFDRMLAAGNSSGAGRLLDKLRDKMSNYLAEGGSGPLS